MFKKILFGLVCAATLTACTDDYNDWASPQANAPETAQHVTFTATDAAAIRMADVTTDSVVAFVPQLISEEGSTVTYQLNLTKEGSEEGVRLMADGQGRVLAADLEKAVVDFYGRRPSERTLSAEVVALVNLNGQVVRKVAENPVKILVTPLAPVIETAYYIIGDGIGWDYAGAKAHAFTHSGKDVYDDPVFTVTVPAPCNEDGTRKDFYFKIVPASMIATGDLVMDGVLGSDTGNGDDRPQAGMAVGGGAFCQHAADEAKFYKITLNMMDYRMSVEALSFSEWIYMPGNPQGWNPAEAPALRSASFDGIYVGYAALDGEFKFTKARSWDGGEYNYSNFNTYGEGFAEGGGSNIKWTGEAGYYKITADIANGVLSAVRTSWGIIGSAQPGGWDKDTDMTYNKSEDCWETTLDLKADEFKFRANDGWDINFGGDMDNLTEGGSNIKLAEAGNYTVKLYLSCSKGKTTRYCTLTKN